MTTSEQPVSKSLRIYLRDHEAAARGGRDLFLRAVSSQGDRPWGDDLRRLSQDVQADLQTLRGMMKRLRVAPDHVMGVAVQAGERLGRLKPNGHLLQRAPLSDLIEVEGMLNAVHAKLSGWTALAALNHAALAADVEQLLARAEDQRQRLLTIHRTVASQVLLQD